MNETGDVYHGVGSAALNYYSAYTAQAGSHAWQGAQQWGAPFESTSALSPQHYHLFDPTPYSPTRINHPMPNLGAGAASGRWWGR